MNNPLVVAVLIALLLGPSTSKAEAADLTGTWSFSVDLETGGHGDPTFVFQQKGAELSGTYLGPLGEQKVTGTMKGDQAVFWFEASRDGQTVKATYTGTMESPTKMTGTIEFSTGAKGKWTAAKKAE